MKKIKSIQFVVSAVILMAVNQAIQSQQTVALIPSQSEMKIKGTSSLHDWEEKVDKFNVSLNLHFREKEISGIDKVQFICKSNSVVSDNSMMTNKTHNALQVDKYPDIVFKLVSVDKLSSQDGNFSGTLVGDVILAGVTKRISLVFTGNHTGNKISIKGSKDLSLNDFKIKPPTAMMGTLKTGDQITISFLLNFQVS